MEIKIRRAAVGDSPGLARLQVNSYRTAYAGILPEVYLNGFTFEEQEQDWRDLLSGSPHGELFVAESDAGKIMGYVLGAPGSEEIAPYDCELVALHVHPSAQGQGIGRKLITAVVEALKKAGCTALLVWVLQDNPARSLYEHLGGRLVGEKDWGGNDEFATAVKEVAYGWSDMAGLAAAVK